MTKEEKAEIIQQLAGKFATYDYFYITDTSYLNVSQINSFRKLCFEKGIEYKVVKNTLIAKALEKLNKTDYTEFNTAVLKGSSGILFSTSGNAPAKLLKEFKSTGVDKVIFKGASIDSAFFYGDSLDVLVSLKSKQELIGDIIGLLQSPAKNVVSALQSGKHKLAGIVKTLADKNQ